MGDTKHEPSEVIEGIEEALRVGLEVKVNMVVQRSLNETQIVPIADMCFQRTITPRFIEFMDVGVTNQWNLEAVVSGQEIREILSKEFGDLEAVIPDHPSDVARRWTTPQGYEFGLIQSVTEPFCGDCSRARISANGSLYTCLFASEGHDLRALLRFDANHDQLEHAIQSIWMDRKDRYSEQRTKQVEVPSKVEMSFIGG
jgi:cyclic pyranopterin phosphate synthase